MDSPRSDATPETAADVRTWFAAEVQLHERTLRSYVRTAFPAVRDVDDVMQESYLRLWHRRAAEPIRSARAFLLTAARRIAIDWLRREARSPICAVREISDLLVPDEGADPTSVAARAMHVEILADAVAALPPRCREIFLLCQVQGLSQQSVAQKLGLSENTVAVQSARGLQRCAAFVSRRLRQP